MSKTYQFIIETRDKATAVMNKLGASSADVRKKIGAAGTQADKLGNKAQKGGRKAEAAFNRVNKRVGVLNSTFGRLGTALAGAFALRSIVRYGQESMSLYNIQAQAEAQLLNALKGKEDVQQRLIAQAQKLQSQTLFGDEETIRAQALIGAFVKEEAQISKVIPLVQDMASAKGMDLAGAADLVSKTLGSSTNALSRYGIQVEGAVGSNERLASLTRALSDAFGGAAKDAALAGTGGLQQLTNKYNDMRESIGALITGGVNRLIPAGNAVVDIMQSSVNWIKQNSDVILSLATGLGTAAGAWAVYKVGLIAGAAWTKLMTIQQIGLNAAFKASPLGWVATALGLVAAGAAYAWQNFEGFRSTVTGLWYGFKQTFTNIKNLLGDVVSNTIAPFLEAWAAFQNGDYGKAAKLVGKGVVGASVFGAGKDLAIGMTKIGEGVADAYEQGAIKGSENFRKAQQNGLTGAFAGVAAQDALFTDNAATPALDNAATKGTEVVTGGGAKQTSISISFEQMVRELKITSQSSKEGIRDMEAEITKVFLRILNSANNMALS